LFGPGPATRLAVLITTTHNVHFSLSLLGDIVSQIVQPGKVLVANLLSRHVCSTEATGIKLLNLLLTSGRDFGNRIPQILQILVQDPVTANLGRNLFLIPIVGNEFMLRRNINAVNVGIPNRRCGAAEKDLLGARIPRHEHNLVRRRAPHNGIVHQEHVLTGKLALDRVELEADALDARLLSRHNKGPGNVPILDESLPERSVEVVRRLERRRATRIGNGNHNVNFVLRVHLLDAVRQLFSHFETAFVDADAVHDGVGAGKVNVLKDAGSETGSRVAHASVAVALHVDKDGLAGLDVTV
jgi:hypothetical protein